VREKKTKNGKKDLFKLFSAQNPSVFSRIICAVFPIHIQAKQKAKLCTGTFF